MAQFSLIKVVAAFVAGVVVALGSALIFVKVSDMQPQPTARAMVVPVPPAPAQPLDTGLDSTDQTPVPPPDDSVSQPPASEPLQRPKGHKSAPETHREIAKSAAHPMHREQPNRATLEVAQNTPLIPVSAPAPVVNEAPLPALQTTQPQTPPEPQSQEAPAPAPTLVPQPHVVTLDSGSNVVIRLGETLSTDHNYTGDTFRAALEAPIIRDGFIIAERGSKVLGRVVNAEKAGRVQGVSDLTLVLTEINTTDGQRVRIESTTYDKKGPVTTGDDAAKIAGGAALGAIIGAVAGGGKGAAIGAGVGGAAGTGAVIATRGKPAVLPTETRLTFRLATPVTITEKLNN